MALILRSDATRIPLADGSVHCVVTSSPYFGLRRYASVPETVWGGDLAHAHVWGTALPAVKPGQVPQTKWANAPAVADGQRAGTGAFCACGAWKGTLGNEPTVDLYVAHLVECFREIRRVLRDDGVAWVVIGDSFASGSSGGFRPGSWGDGCIDERGQRNRNGTVAQPDTAAGNLLLVPWRVALALQQDGWIVRNDLAWCKRAAMPESVSGWRWERHRVKVARGEVARDGMNGSGQRPHGATIAEPSRVAYGPARPQQNHAHGEAHSAFAPRAEWRDCPGCERCAPNGGLVLRRGSWRHTRAHEVVLMLAKSMQYFTDAEAVQERAIHEGRVVKAHNDKEGGGRAPNRQTAGLAGKDNLVGATRNPRSWMLLGPEPLAAQHYAAFPTALVEPLILASTSARGVCAECGAPWARVVEQRRTLDGVPVDLPPMRNTDIAEPDSAQGVGHWRTASESRTLGWHATCAHADTPPVPATVLDPFVGSGTVLAVAERHGRRAVGCDLSQTYLRDIAARRTAQPPLADWIGAEQ